MRYVSGNTVELICLMQPSGTKQRFVPHADAMKRRPRHYKCCQKHDIASKRWLASPVPCAPGTHDRWCGVVECVQFRRGNLWRPKDREKIIGRRNLWYVSAQGEIARRMESFPVGTLMILRGVSYLMRKFGNGSRPQIEVVEVIPVTEDQINGHAMGVAIAAALENIPPEKMSTLKMTRFLYPPDYAWAMSWIIREFKRIVLSGGAPSCIRWVRKRQPIERLCLMWVAQIRTFRREFLANPAWPEKGIGGYRRVWRRV